MPTKPLSRMTGTDFIEYKAALGLNTKQMAAALNRRSPTITGYENGNPIPAEIHRKLGELIEQERARIKTRDGKLIDLSAGLGSMIVHQNEMKYRRSDQHGIHRTQGRFMRRQRKQDTATYPVYRMTIERYKTYTQALKAWADHVRELSQQYGDPARQRDYQLELADIRALAACAPRSAPYDVCIQRNEWDVVSRALRHLAKDPSYYAPAHSLRCHWSKYRGSGYPVRRS